MNEYERILQEAAADKAKQAADDEHVKEIIKSAVREAMKERDGRPTKESILAEPNTEKRLRLIRQNIDLFKN